jgi:tetratricopeptide (TPR) repeat protein
MDLELDNIRTAWAWATANAHISQIERAAEPLAHYYDARWRDPECSAAMHAAAETLEVTASAEGLHALITVLAWEARYCDDLDRAQRTLERCLVLLERPELAHTDTRRVRALVLDSMAYSHLLRQAAPTRALACVDESLTLYRALADRWGLLRALTTACMVRRFAFDLAEAERLGQEAVSVARALGHLEQVAWNLTLVSNVVHFQGDYERGEHLGREAVALYRQLGDRLGVALGLSQLSTLLINQGKFADTRAVGLESIQILRELGREDLVSMPALWLGYAEMCLGNYAEAKAQLEIKLAGRDADGLGGPFALMGLAQLAIASGHAERAIQLQRQCVAMMRQVNEHLALAGSLAVLAAILVTAGLPEEARPHLVESLCLIDAHPYPTPPSQLLAASALFLAQEGDVERATEVWALAASHRLVSDSRWFQDVFGTPITAAAQALPPPARVAAEERGRVRDIRQTVKELLADLRPDSN